MIIEEFKKIKSGTRQLRQFGTTMGFVLFVLGVVVFLRKKDFPVALCGASVLFFLLGFMAPASLKWLQRAWMLLAIVMGWFMTRLIMGVLFFLILTPIAFLARLARKRFMDLEFKNDERETYWNWRKGQKIDRAYYERQF